MQPLWLNPARQTSGHQALRETVQRFVARELAPHATEWDEAGEFPRDLYPRAAAAGLFGLRLPEEFGGVPDADFLHSLILCVELAQCGAGGLLASLLSHAIAAPPIAAWAPPSSSSARCRASCRVNGSRRSR